MADVFDKEQRSEVMRKVKSKGNKSTEIRLINIFRELKITGWRRGYPVKGHPDFVFLDMRLAVFVDGCFWHGHNCHNTHPKDNEIYWENKIKHNVAHDKAITDMFIQRGWVVLRIWECELKKKNSATLIERLSGFFGTEYTADGNSEPIIPEEMFNRVQEERSRRSNVEVGRMVAKHRKSTKYSAKKK